MSLEEDFIIALATVENTTNKTTQYLILERYNAYHSFYRDLIILLQKQLLRENVE